MQRNGKKNSKKFHRKINEIYYLYEAGQINYDTIYDFIEGWIAYAKHANTYKLRQRILSELERKFPMEISAKEVNRSLPKRKRRI